MPADERRHPLGLLPRPGSGWLELENDRGMLAHLRDDVVCVTAVIQPDQGAPRHVLAAGPGLCERLTDLEVRRVVEDFGAEGAREVGAHEPHIRRFEMDYVEPQVAQELDSGDALALVAVPEATLRIVSKVLREANADILRAYNRRPDGYHTVVLVEVDNRENPTLIVDVNITYLTFDELRAQDASAVDKVVDGFRLASISGQAAALFVVQDNSSAALLVRSLSEQRIQA